MFFSSVYIIDGACFEECFLFHVIAGRRYFFSKFVVTVRFFQPPYCRFLWNKRFEISPYFTLSPQCSANTNTNAKFQNKGLVYYTYTYAYLKNFPSWLFLWWSFPHSLFHDFSTLFFINEFFWKTQNISDSMFFS